MLYTTQCTQTILGAFGSGASGSSIIRTRLLAPLGASSHASGGETSSPSQVYFEGMWPFCWKAGDFRVMAMAAFPHRIISEAAKRITASLEFRSGDTPPSSVMNSRLFIDRIAFDPPEQGSEWQNTGLARISSM